MIKLLKCLCVAGSFVSERIGVIMSIVLTLATLFFVGSLGGWVFEVFFRKFLSDSNPDRRWINPGFLVGPYLPIYGFGLMAMYLFSRIPLDFIPSKGWQTAARLIIIIISMTVIEYIAGLIFIKGMKIKLWDYSRRLGNIDGIICPLFSMIWGAAGAIYLFLIHPHIQAGLDWLAANLAYSFFVGFFFGVLAIDISYSLQIVVKLRKFAADNRIVIRYEELKAHIKRNREKAHEKARFIFAFRTDRPFSEHLSQYLVTVRQKEAEARKKWESRK